MSARDGLAAVGLAYPVPQAWRDVFTPYHRGLAEKRFGDLLPLYGYQ